MNWESDYYDSVESGLNTVIELLDADFGAGNFDDVSRAIAEESYEEALENLAESLVEMDRPVPSEISDPILYYAESIGIDDLDVIISFRAWVDDHA